MINSPLSCHVSLHDHRNKLTWLSNIPPKVGTDFSGLDRDFPLTLFFLHPTAAQSKEDETDFFSEGYKWKEKKNHYSTFLLPVFCAWTLAFPLTRVHSSLYSQRRWRRNPPFLPWEPSPHFVWFHLAGCDFTLDQNKTLKTLSSAAQKSFMLFLVDYFSGYSGDTYVQN